MFASSRSNPSAIRGKNSSTITSEPSRLQTDPNSRPIAPPPMTSNFSGALSKVSASVLLTMTLPSNFMLASSTGMLPVAMTTFFVSISCESPSFGLIETRPGALTVPKPWNVVTLFPFINIFTPLFIVFTTLSLRASIFARSSPTFSKTMPCLPASFFAKT